MSNKDCCGARLMYQVMYEQYLLHVRRNHPPSPVAGVPGVALQPAFPVSACNVPVEVCSLCCGNSSLCRDERLPTCEQSHYHALPHLRQEQGNQNPDGGRNKKSLLCGKQSVSLSTSKNIN